MNKKVKLYSLLIAHHFINVIFVDSGKEDEEISYHYIIFAGILYYR